MDQKTEAEKREFADWMARVIAREECDKCPPEKQKICPAYAILSGTSEESQLVRAGVAQLKAAGEAPGKIPLKTRHTVELDFVPSQREAGWMSQYGFIYGNYPWYLKAWVGLRGGLNILFGKISGSHAGAHIEMQILDKTALTPEQKALMEKFAGDGRIHEYKPGQLGPELDQLVAAMAAKAGLSLPKNGEEDQDTHGYHYGQVHTDRK